MIDLDKTEDLARLYRMYTSVPNGLPTMKRALKVSIARRGKDINAASLTMGENEGRTKAIGAQQVLTMALKWVDDILLLKDKFDAVWVEAFKRDREIEASLNEVC